MPHDPRRHAPAAARNRDPILEVLRQVLPARGLVLEIASGSGEHAVHLARALPDLEFQPSDPDTESRRSIAGWREAEALPNLLTPLPLDATQPAATWPLSDRDAPLTAMLCINMIHIAAWEACLGLLDGAAHWLGPGRPLYLYGPYQREGRHTAPSNAAFDASLRERNPRWGVRDLDQVTREAEQRGLDLERVVEMPANNLSVVLRRA